MWLHKKEKKKYIYIYIYIFFAKLEVYIFIFIGNVKNMPPMFFFLSEYAAYVKHGYIYIYIIVQITSCLTSTDYFV